MKNPNKFEPTGTDIAIPWLCLITAAIIALLLWHLR